MGVAVVVIANDFSAINVALPTMERDFDTNVNTIQGVVNAYALTFGAMIVTGGRLADMFGRRNALFLGTAIFASMSALGGAAQTETWLIMTRTLMGIGGALMWPAILGMTYAILPEDKAGLAGGIVYMFQIAGGSIGLGLTTTVFSAQGSFVDGIEAAFRLDAGLSLVGFLVALFFVGGRLLGREGAAGRAPAG